MARSEYSYLYGRTWRKARAAFLKENPLCAMHLEMGKIVASDTVDHKQPHRGDPVLFWDQNNWQALCEHCHNSHKQAEERGRGARGATVDGIPRDTSHHWLTG